jgi:hypothetical protein
MQRSINSFPLIDIKLKRFYKKVFCILESVLNFSLFVHVFKKREIKFKLNT